MVTNTVPQCVWAAVLLVAASACGCGPPATPTRRVETLAPSAGATPEPRPWVFVRAPDWSTEITTISTPGPSPDYCITSNSTRACVSDGSWTDIAWGSTGELWLTGRSGDSWVFDDYQGHVFVSRGFTGALRELPQALPTRALGRPWHIPARLAVDGTLLEWSGSGFTPMRFPARIYDAAFTAQSPDDDTTMGILLAEPGVVHLREAGQPWTPAVQPSLAPRAAGSLDRATLPERFGALVDEASLRGLPMDREFREGVERAWLTEQVRRFGQHRGATLPDLVPSLLHQLVRRSLVVPPGSMRVYEGRPLTHGWLARGDRDGNVALVHVSPDLTTQVLVEGHYGLVLSSHDGMESLALGRVCRADEVSDEKGRSACFTDASGPHTVRLPLGTACAEVVALGSGQLLVGGDGCPAEVCGDHLMVRFDLRQTGELEAIPVPVEGDVPHDPSVGDGDCHSEVDSASDIIPDGASVLGALSTEAGERLLSGPLTGPLRALPLPAEGDTAFADAHHGVLLAEDGAWTTANGGETWDPVPIPMDASGDLSCSAEVCRLGDLYWLEPGLSTRLGLDRESLAAAPFEAQAPRWPSRPRWQLTGPARATLAPSNTLPALRESPPRHAKTWVEPVVGGIVETNFRRPDHTRDFAWRGVTPDGSPFHVVTTAAHPVGASATSPIDDYEVLAMTESFVVLSVPSSGAPFEDLWIIRSDGRSSRHTTQFPRFDPDAWDQARWPLPLPDGGLGIYVFVDGLRWLVHLGPDGEVIALRALRGLPYRLDEALAWQGGELGLAVRTSDGLARLYVIDGTEREIALPRAPEGPCQGAALPESNLFASQWGEPEGAVEGPASPRIEWIMSEEHGGRACMRAMVPRWRTADNDDMADGSELVMAVGGALRGWFVSVGGTVEWPATFPGTAMPMVEQDTERDGLSGWALSLMSVRTGLQLWAPEPAGRRSRMSLLTWENQHFTLVRANGLEGEPRDFATRPGMLLRQGAAYPVDGGVIQPQREPPENGQFADGMHNERGTTLVTRNTPGGMRVDWPGENGEPLHSYLARAATVSDWRWPMLTNDGRAVVTVTSRGGQGDAELQLHRLRSDGTIQASATTEILEESFERYLQFKVASAGPSVVAAVLGMRGRPLYVFGTSGTRPFRPLGHPIATTRCWGDLLAVAAAPPRVVWTDCAIGTERRFVRVAQLAGNRWREVVDAHPLPPGVTRVAATVDHAHGVYVVYLENREAVLVTLRDSGWEVVTRYVTPAVQP